MFSLFEKRLIPRIRFYQFRKKQRCHVKGQIPLIGPDDTFNINPMLLRNIAKSPYFIKCCQNLQEWGALVDEIYYEVKHMEPWADGTCFI